MSKKYSYLFFDLDHTLWDYEVNALVTLQELYEKFQIHQLVPDFNHFRVVFEKINAELWDDYQSNKIPQHDIRTKRFTRVLDEFFINDSSLANKLSDFYVEEGPKKNVLVPGALDLLNHLAPNYGMLILTNGFERTQHVKLKSAGIDHFFDAVISSEKTGFSKPAPEIFNLALTHSKFKKEEVLMIGDNLLTDITGAKVNKIDSVFYNPLNAKDHIGATYEVSSLVQLKDML